MRYRDIRDLCESEAIEYYTPMAKELGMDSSDNMAVRKLIETADHIHADCQFYLSQIKGVDNGFPRDLEQSIAYRGMDKGKYWDTQIILKDVRLDDRKPLDSDDVTHSFLNSEFTKLYGAPFRNAMFMSGSARDTLRYGHTFQVFPVGQFKFIWSPTVNDLWVEARDLRRAYAMPDGHGNEEEQLKNQKYKADVKKEFHEKVIATYQTGDMKAALASGKEIMVRCKQYYAVNFDNITNNILDSTKLYPDSYWNKIRVNSEELFYNIVNNK